MENITKKCPFCSGEMKKVDSRMVLANPEELYKRIEAEANQRTYNMKKYDVDMLECNDCGFVAHFSK